MFKLILILQLLIVVVISFRSPLSSSSLLLKTKTILQLNCVEEKVSTSTPSEQEKYQLFAGNLPFSLSNDELKQIVADRVGLNSGKFNAKIALDKKTGKSRGFGYIESDEMLTKDQYASLVSSLSGVEIEGRSIKFDVTQSKPRQFDGQRREFNREKVISPKENSVFVGNLDSNVNPKDVENLFINALGADNVINVRIAPPKDGTRFRFGHIDLANPEIALKAIELLNNSPLNGNSIFVAPAERKEDRLKREENNPKALTNSRPRQNYPSVYLGNLAWDLNLENIEDMLNDVLGPDQYITVRMAIDRETGKQKGYAHIDFKDEEIAKRAVNELNGLEVLGRQLRADIAQRTSGRDGGFNRGPRKDRYESGSEGDNMANW